MWTALAPLAVMLAATGCAGHLGRIPPPPLPAAAPRAPAGPPAQALLRYALAIQAVEDGRLDEAREHLGVALLFDPQAAALHRALGEVLAAGGDPYAGIAELDRALALDPADRSARLALARLLARVGDPVEASSHYRRLLAEGPDDVAFAELAAMQLSTGARQEAADTLAAWGSTPLSDPDLLARRAGLNLEASRDAAAWDDFAALLLDQRSLGPDLDGLLAANLACRRNRSTLDLLERLADLEPGNEEILVRLGRLAADVGDHARAEAAWRRLDRLQGGTDPATKRLLAETLIGQGRPAEALRALDEADALRGDPEASRWTRADALLAQGRVEAALAALERAQGGAEPWVRLAERAGILERAGRLIEARDALQEAASTAPAWSIAETLASLEARTGGLDRGLSLLAEHPREPASAQALALARLRDLAGERAGALAALAAAEVAWPMDPELSCQRARWLDEAGERAAARAVLAEAHSRGATSAGLAWLRAHLARETPGEARALLEAGLAAFPDHAGLQNDLAWVRVQAGDVGDEVLALARRAVDQRPADPAFLDTLGWALYRRGQIAEALPELQHAARLAPDNAVIAAHLREVAP